MNISPDLDFPITALPIGDPFDCLDPPETGLIAEIMRPLRPRNPVKFIMVSSTPTSLQEERKAQTDFVNSSFILHPSSL